MTQVIAMHAPAAVRGREAERRVVRDLLDRAQRGAGGVVLIEGEPGIGKSLMLRESVDEAAGQGFSLAVGAADQLGTAIPFFALRQALGEPFGRQLAALADDDQLTVPAWWISQIRAHLEQLAAAGPVLVCLDDVQWAGQATLAALWTLPQELRGYPIAWLLARSVSPQREAEHLFRLLEDEGAARVRLAPLADQEVAGLLTEAFGAPPQAALRALAAGAAGNPWLLSELVSGLREENGVRVTDEGATLVSTRLPRRLHRAARERLAGLGDQARNVLVTAAVLGEKFRLEDIAEMLGETPAVLLAAVEETMAAGITVAGENEFSFRHELLRRAVGETTPRPGRRALHRQYGQILLDRGESAALAGCHLLQAADPDNPASLTDLDAAAAQTIQAEPQTAADLASSVLELTPAGDPEELPRAVAAAEALAAAGRLDQADRVATDTLAKPLPPVTEARLRSVLSSVLCSRGETADAAAEARRALALPELPDDLRDIAMTALLRAMAGARDAAGRPLAEKILSEPDRHDGPVAVGALILLAVTSWDLGRAEEALELLRDAARHETSVSPDARRVQPLIALAATLVDLRQVDEAETILQAADGRALHTIPARTAAAIVRARIHLAGGRLADAEAAAADALTTAEAMGAYGYASAARCVLAVVALRGGDVTAAAEHLATGVVARPHVGEVYARPEIAMAEALVSEARDRRPDAVALIRQAYGDLGARPGLLLGDPATAASVTRTALAAGETELAAAVAAAAGSLAAANPGYPAITAAAAHSLGLARRDPELLAEAVAAHPDPWARASAAEDLGGLHAEEGEHDLAVRHLTDAVNGYLEVGAAADAARTRRSLRKLGVRHREWTRPVLRPLTGWESLTDAERTAAELVAQGLNNRQVAGRMYVSEHTVAFYLRQAFRKLDIRSRVQLARIVIEHRPAPDSGSAAAN
ncbi:MAG TPA: AAA family ATPase [Trebonia sp.]